MRALTSIGEIGLEYGDRKVILRPSLRAMDSLGDPEEIVKLFAEVFSRVPVPTRFPEYNAFLVKKHWETVTWASYQVIKACADEDISDFLGVMGSRYGTFRQGFVPISNFAPLARCLLKHGIIGDVERSSYGEQTTEGSHTTPVFEARVFVAQATTHLGYSEAAAWDMTVTSFLLAMQAKLGKKKSNMPPKDHVVGISEYLKQVNAARKVQPKKTMTEADFDAAMSKISRAKS